MVLKMGGGGEASMLFYVIKKNIGFAYSKFLLVS